MTDQTDQTDETVNIEVFLDRIEDTVAEFSPVDKADDPGRGAMWCFEELLPDTYVSNGVFMAEVDADEMRVRKLEYLPDRTEEFKIKTARMQLKAEEKVKESGDFPTRDDN